MPLFLVCALLMPNITVFGYSYAEDTYEVTADYITETEKAAVTEAGLKMVDGGRAVYRFLPPFNVSGLALTAYDYGRLSVTVTIDGQTYEYEGNGMVTQTFDKVIRKQDLEVTIEAKSTTVISKLEVIREDRVLPVGRGMTLMDIPDEEYRLQTAAVYMTGASAFIGNSAVRYVDYTDADKKVEIINGSMYAPVAALAIGLSLYREEIPEEKYLLLRRDSSAEFAAFGDYVYYQYNAGEKVAIENPVVYKDGMAWLPVRFIAELFGDVVEFKDGIAVIDNKYSARSIIDDETMMSYIRDVLTDYKQTNDNGKTYYVAQTANASDANDGSEAAPFKTLAKAGEVVQAGDTVIVGGGTYREVLKVAANGEKARPITFKAKEGETPVISALEKVQDFATYPSDEVVSDQIVVAQLKTTLGDGRNMVFMNNEALAEGRHPNTSTSPKFYVHEPLKLSPLWPTEGNMHIRTATEEEKKNKTSIYDVVSDTDLDQPKDYWKGGTFVGLLGSAWSMSIGKIQSSQPGMISMDPEHVGYTWFDNDWQEKLNDCGYITNNIHTVDMPGEWYIDDEEKMLYIYPPEGTTVDTLELETKARQLVIDLEKNSYVTIEGFETIGGGVRMNEGEMNVINDCELRYISHFTYYADNRDGYLDSRDDLFKEEGGAPQRGEVGIYIGNQNNVIANCHIDHSAGAAVYSTGAYSLIENNYMNDCGYMSSIVGGIFLSGKAYLDKDSKRGGDMIYYNTIDRVGRSCVGYENQHDQDTNPMTGSIPLDIAYNDFANGMIYARDGALVYTHGMSLGSDNTWSKVHNNMFRNTWNIQDWGNNAIYHDNITLFQEVYDNLMFNENGLSYQGGIVFTHPNSGLTSYWGVVDEWNNTLFAKYTTLQRDEIKPEDYPGGKPFKTGSSLVNGVYRANIDNLNTDFGWYTCAAITNTENVTVEKGMATLNDEGAWIEYKNVDFGELSNQIEFYFAADKYNSGDKVKIVVGDSLETGRKTLAVMNSTSPYTDGSNYLAVGMGKLSGVQNVYIQSAEQHSLSIKKFRPSYDEDVQYSIYTFHADELTRYIETDDPNSVGAPKFFNIPHDTRHQYINATWNNTVLIYEDVELMNTTDMIKWEAATAEENAGEFEVYLDSLDSEPVAKASITPLGWGNYNVEEAKTLKTIDPGKYTVYIKFVGVGKTADWCNLQFCNTSYN